MRKFELKNLELHKDNNKYGGYYLSAKYIEESENQIREITIPRLELPVYRDYCTVRTEPSLGITPSIYVDLGFGELSATSGMKEKVLWENPKKMTLEEIEKKLGHKIELVSGK